MGSTTAWNITYPDTGFAPNVPVDMQKLAQTVDTALTAVNRGSRAQLSKAAQNIPTGTAVTALVWSSTDYITGDLQSGLAGITIHTAGWYDISAACEISPNATGRRYIAALKNVTEMPGFNPRITVPVNSGSLSTGLVLPPVSVKCVVGDVLNVNVFQDSGSTLTITAGAILRVERRL